jgi:glycosyltransferase involved in cell wall biosynthesis
MLPTVSDLTAAKQTHLRTEDNQGPVLRDSISVVIPAYNEEKYLPATLMAVIRAKKFLEAERSSKVEVVVVDNDSTDQTDQIARDHGALVIHEVSHNIAKVRNTGARASIGGVLVFVDADTVVPESLLWRIAQVMCDPASVGGAVDTDYRPARPVVRAC